MLPSPTTSHVLVAPSNERTLRFPIKLLVGTQTVETSGKIIPFPSPSLPPRTVMTT